jgi:hypothetical protein
MKRLILPVTFLLLFNFLRSKCSHLHTILERGQSVFFRVLEHALPNYITKRNCFCMGQILPSGTSALP